MLVDDIGLGLRLRLLTTRRFRLLPQYFFGKRIRHVNHGRIDIFLIGSQRHQIRWDSHHHIH